MAQHFAIPSFFSFLLFFNRVLYQNASFKNILALFLCFSKKHLTFQKRPNNRGEGIFSLLTAMGVFL